jgi:hypothetical protein
MRVSGIPGYELEVASVLQEDARQLCRWRTVAPAGLIVAPHHHHRDEVLTVRSGRIRFVFDQEQPIELAAGQRLLIPANTTHSHVVLEATELDYLGEARAGLFVWDAQADGTVVETELYISGLVWSRPEAIPAHCAATDRRRLYQLAEEPPASPQ